MGNSKPEAFIFMKVGIHGGECLEKILNRKKIELKKAKKIFWGYGGTVLHPTNQVQRFVKEQKREGLGYIEVLMEEITGDSKSGPPAGTAKQYAESETECMKPIPNGVCTGGKHALVLGEITELKPPLRLDLRDYEVGIGNKKETNATDYVKYRTDKGALVKATSKRNRPKEPKYVLIKYKARLVAPYAVFLWPVR